jgi:hypothetical protein
MSSLSHRDMLSVSPLPWGGPHSLEGCLCSPFPRGALASSGCVSLSDLQRDLTLHPMVWLQVELSDGTAHTITDAYAGKEYIIQVAAKDNEIGTWSDWSVAAHATPWTEEPRHLTTEAQAPGEPALCLCSLWLSWSALSPGPLLFPSAPSRNRNLYSILSVVARLSSVCPVSLFLVLVI